MRLLVSLLFVSLAACGGSKKPANEPDPAMATQPAEAEPQAAPASESTPEGSSDKATADPCEGGEAK